jgi:hypothetical protein
VLVYVHAHPVLKYSILPGYCVKKLKVVYAVLPANDMTILSTSIRLNHLAVKLYYEYHNSYRNHGTRTRTIRPGGRDDYLVPGTPVEITYTENRHALVLYPGILTERDFQESMSRVTTLFSTTDQNTRPFHVTKQSTRTSCRYYY